MNIPKTTIFLADDDEDDRDFFEEVIENIDSEIEFKSFNDGSDLLSFLKSSTDTIPNFIFLDLNMPLMGGEKCLLKIREIDKLIDVPIILYSTFIDRYKINLLKESGATLYLKKPNSFKKLTIAILECMEKVKANKQKSDDQSNFIVQ